MSELSQGMGFIGSEVGTIYSMTSSNNSSGVSSEDIKNAVNEYLAQNPPTSGATSEQIDQINQNSQDISQLSTEKLDKQQGSENAGKLLGVGEDGNVCYMESDVSTDETLSIKGQAADAAIVGQMKVELENSLSELENSLSNAETKHDDDLSAMDADLKELSANVLSKDNVDEYIPSNDYNPATKKYVDDLFSTIVNGDGVSY